MQVHHLGPGMAWLQYKDGWYLVSERDGRVSDWSLGTAIHLIDHFETEVGHADVFEEIDFEFLVRHVRDDIGHGAAHVFCDLLIYEDESEDVEKAIEGAVRQVLDKLIGDAYWTGAVVSYDLAFHRADREGDDEHGSVWFERFLREPATVPKDIR